MQLRLPWFLGRDQPSPAPGLREIPERHVLVSGEPVGIAVVRHRRARRYVVRVSDDGSVQLTVPRGASIAGGVRFAAQQVDWIARERQRRRERLAPWGEGSDVWFRGERRRLAIGRGAIAFAGERVPAPGPLGCVRSAVESHLRTLATRELTARCHELAARCGQAVARVGVRNQRSRWGACSPRGGITLNWRLIQMPAHVSDYVIFHELMHLRQPNHSRRFWREVESVCPGWREAERWLRRHGRDING